MRIICLLFFTILAARTWAQVPASKEEFVNEVFAKLSETTPPHYYLVAGTDTCRFEKYDYDEWIKYHLRETVPLTTLNELAYKVHITRTPYYWRQDKLQKASCITALQADSLTELQQQVYSFSQPQFTDDGQYAVIDVNWKSSAVFGGGYTFLFRHTKDGWKRVGAKLNWGGDQ